MQLVEPSLKWQYPMQLAQSGQARLNAAQSGNIQCNPECSPKWQYPGKLECSPKWQDPRSESSPAQSGKIQEVESTQSGNIQDVESSPKWQVPRWNPDQSSNIQATKLAIMQFLPPLQLADYEMPPPPQKKIKHQKHQILDTHETLSVMEKQMHQSLFWLKWVWEI